MSRERNLRNLVILLLILTLVNVAALFTMFSVAKGSEKDRDSGQKTAEYKGGILTNEVGFDSIQLNQVRELKTRFKEGARPIIDSLRVYNETLRDELASAEPDTVQMAHVTNLIGSEQAKLKMMTVRHLMEVRTIARPDQQSKLTRFYDQLLLRDRYRTTSRGGASKTPPYHSCY